jgi:protein TonB
MADERAPVTPADRLSFTLFLAVALHATLILGLGFAPEPPSEPASSMDVTITRHQSDTAPEEADFIAQADQKGSGDQDEKKELTTTEQAEFSDQQVQRVQKKPQALQRPEKRNPQPMVVTTSAVAPQQREQQEKREDQPPRPEETAERESLQKLSRDIASLQARLDHQKQAYAERPRVRRVTSVSAKASYEAKYIDRFRRSVEKAGTRNFPGRALAEQAFGNVRLMVALKDDGTVTRIRVLRSSGHDFLDEAAMRSVRLAAPFDRFPEQMRGEVDRLEIIRTWKFNPREVMTSE